MENGLTYAVVSVNVLLTPKHKQGKTTVETPRVINVAYGKVSSILLVLLLYSSVDRHVV